MKPSSPSVGVRYTPPCCAAAQAAAVVTCKTVSIPYTKGVRVKICGITNAEDALAAEAAGADAVGLIFAERSKRRVTPAQARAVSDALGPFITRVGVFVDAPLENVLQAAKTLRLGAVQLHGTEPPEYAEALRSEVRVVKVFAFTPGLAPDTLRRFPADAVMLDGLTGGGGETFSWNAAGALRGFPNLVLAGGLTPHNVAAGVRALRPYAVDVASGVERAIGLKDHTKVQDFVRAARAAR